MPVMPILETAIGLCFIFLLGAVFTSGAVEWFANLVKKRAKDLLVGLRELFEPSTVASNRKPGPAFKSAFGGGDQRELYRRVLDPGGDLKENPVGSRWRKLGVSHAADSRSGAEDTNKRPPLTVDEVMGHALIQPLKAPGPAGGKRRNPSYIPSDTIAKVVLDLLLPSEDGAPATLEHVVKEVKEFPEGPLRSALLALAKSADGELNKFREGVQKWYDSQMDRVTGAYKRWAKKWSVAVAVAVVLGLHLDAIAIATDLWTDESVRTAVVAAAVDIDHCLKPTEEGEKPAGDEQSMGDDQSVEDGAPQSDDDKAAADAKKADCVQTQIAALRSDGLPIGFEQWGNHPKDFGGWVSKFLGFAISMAAISMGAPFWFGLMNKLINVRNAGARPSSTSS